MANALTDWLGTATGLWETRGSKTEREGVKNLRDRYNNNATRLQNLVQQNTGIQGQKKALQAGKNMATDLANQAGNQAAQQARNAGMNATAAAALGAQSGASNYGNLAQQQQQNMYNAMGNEITGQQNVLNANQQQIGNQTEVLNNQKNMENAVGKNTRAWINTALGAAFGPTFGLGSGLGGEAGGAK